MSKLLLTTPEILTVIDGAGPRDIDNWLARLEHLSTEYEQPGRGRARRFSRLNTIELACIGAFVSGGAKLSEAAAYAGAVVRNTRYLGQPTREWMIFSPGYAASAIGSDGKALNLSKVGHELGSTVLTAFNVGEIVRRVNALYAAEG
ncbi:MAG: hypothetical protein K0Q60_4701 [Microvirga sp.]|jgi:hypothetical protein|nr:hypothetical protein [Microvirga sp.]